MTSPNTTLDQITEDDINKIETLIGFLQPLYSDLDVFQRNGNWHFLPAVIEEAQDWVKELKSQANMEPSRKLATTPEPVEGIAHELADKRFYAKRGLLFAPTWHDCFVEAEAELQAHTLRAVITELESLVSDPSMPNDCPQRCTDIDPHEPKQQHWHHVAISMLRSRIKKLKTQLERLEGVK